MGQSQMWAWLAILEKTWNCWLTDEGFQAKLKLVLMVTILI